MKKMFFTAVLMCAITVRLFVPYAGPIVTAGKRQVTAEDIIIKESAPGAIKKDKNIYLRCQYVSF